MGRSVIPHPYANVVAYTSFAPDEESYREMFEAEDEDFESWMWSVWANHSTDEWDDLKEWIVEVLTTTWPSFEEADREVGHWNYQTENTVLAQNAHSEVSISEYSGMVAISLAPRSDLDYYDSEDISVLNLGKAWRAQIADRFKRTFSEYEQVGRTSNGEGVYRAVQED